MGRPPIKDGEQLSGLIERVTFHNPETGFAVLKVKVAGHRDLVPVLGQLPAVTAGEWVEASGAWVQNRDHGRQFEAVTLKTSPPTSREGITRYLGSGMVHGLGPQLAGKLVGHFGEKILEIIDNASARLEEVDGIGPTRRRRIKVAWEEQRQVRAIMLFLHSHGVSSSKALRIYKVYGDEAIQKVQADPYLLARDIHGIGFKSADQIASRLGIPKDSPQRLAAGLRHRLMEATQEGHCALPSPVLVESTAELLSVESALVQVQLEAALGNRDLEVETLGGDDLVYVPYMRYAEMHAAGRVLSLANEPPQLPVIDSVKAREWYEGRTGHTLSASQGVALDAALSHRLLVITGGPGVGKTTLIRAILTILQAKKVRCVLGAPTGRAAKRLMEATGLPASTLHRLLEARGGPGRFGRTEERPLEGDYFVVDEVSMVDVPLMWALLRALPSHASLLLVGDADQLPSVGPGSVLGDLLSVPAVASVRLTEVFRQAAQSDIVQNAHRILSGQPPTRATSGNSGDASDFYIIEREEPEDIAATVVDLVARRLPAKYGFSPVNDIQVLAPMNRGILGVRALNEQLQSALNPARAGHPEVSAYGHVFREGDKVMQLENDYEKEVFNGDIGRIQQVDLEMQEVVIVFDETPVRYRVAELDSLTPAYAITVHKSQGSEFPAVVLPVATSHFLLLQRNLLYTAITRGRRLVVLVGQPKAVAMAVRQADAKKRYSGLKYRLAGGGSDVGLGVGVGGNGGYD